MKKILFIALSLMILTVISSCGGSAQDEQGSAPLSVMIIDSANIPEGEGSLTENRWTKLIQENMLEQEIAVEFKSRGGGVASQTIMMATGSAPDIAMTHNRLLFSKFASDGGLTDLAPYIEEYGPNIKKVLGEEFLLYGLIDGIQYAIPSRPDPVERQYISMIRKDWLDELGLEIPGNREELEIVLRAFKEKDPGNIGSDNVIPWGYVPPDSGTVFEPDFKLFDAMYSFMGHDLEKNTSITWPHRDGLKEFLSWMHEMYQDGMIDREFATISYDEKVRKIVNGQVGFFHIPYVGLYDNTNTMAKIEQSGSGIEFVPVEVFQNNDGGYWKVRPRPVGFYLFVPKKSKNPAAAVKYINWLLEDETRQWMNYGIEGEHYELVDGKPAVIDMEYNADSFSYLRRYIRLTGPLPADRAAYDDYEDQSLLFDFKGMDDLAADLMSRDYFPGPIYSEKMPMMSRYGSGLVKICDKYWVKLLTEENFEENYAEFQQKLTDRNIDLIDVERTDYFRRHN